MNFTLAEDIEFRDKWSQLTRACEDLFITAHEELDDKGRLQVGASTVRLKLQEVLSLIPVEHVDVVRNKTYGRFASLAVKHHVRERKISEPEEGLVKVLLIGTRDRINDLILAYNKGK